MPTFKKYKLIDAEEEKPKNVPKTHECTCGDKFITKEEFNALKRDFERLTEKVEEITIPVIEKPKTTTKKTKESEE